jgi:coenzyme F420 hydrogenase subunit beta
MLETLEVAKTAESSVNGRGFPICCYCGACAAFIPDFEQYREEEVVWDKGCGGTISKGFCFSFCPRSFAVCRLCEAECPRLEYGVCDFSPCASSPEGRILGYYSAILSAHATDRAIREIGPDGSVVTALLCAGLRSGFIDAAVVAVRTEDWRPVPYVATTPEEVLLARGPKYTACPMIEGVWEAIDKGYEKIAMVGMGCYIEAVRRLQALHDPALELDRVKLLLGLFDTEAFWHHELVRFLKEREGIDIREVEQFYVARGNFMVVTKDKVNTIPTKELDPCVRDTCRLCEDFTAQLADISAGSVGSPRRWTTLIIRTEVGKELVDVSASAGVINTKKLNAEAVTQIERVAFNKKRKNYEKIKDQMEICAACMTNPYYFSLQQRGGI